MALLTRPAPADMRIGVEDFMQIANAPEYADRLVELVEGEIVTMSLPRGIHGLIMFKIAARLLTFVERRGLGYVTGGDAAFQLERDDHGDTVRGIDIAFISSDKIPGPFPRGLLEIAPDLAVEVMLPSNTVSDTNLKIDQLLRAGCPEVWIVDPDLRRVDVHSEKGIQVYREGDTLACPAILPGFEIAISDIFPSQVEHAPPMQGE